MNHPARILVVDDEPNMRRSLADILREEGYEVITAKDGYEAVEFCTKGQYDVVLMDVRMPGIDGVEAFRRIRNQNTTSRVILMSAYGLDELKKHALDEGAIAFLDKPLDIDKVIGLIEQATETAVLVVAGDNEVSQSLQSKLRDHAYYVTLAASPHDALELVGQIRFGIILIDMSLPEMNGIDLFLAVKKLTPTSIAILMTGDETDFQQTSPDSATKTPYALLQKPLDFNQLVGLLNRIRGETASDAVQNGNNHDG